MVAMCRPLLADPEMPRKYALGREEDRRPCLRCQYCGFRLMIPAVINCAVNPYLGNETEFPEAQGQEGRGEEEGRGGGRRSRRHPGPAHALRARARRHPLRDERPIWAGTWSPARRCRSSRTCADYLDYLVLPGEQGSRAHPPQYRGDEGAARRGGLRRAHHRRRSRSPSCRRFPGIDKPHVHWAPEADTGAVEPGDKTVIVGAGSVGVECADRSQARGQGRDRRRDGARPGEPQGLRRRRSHGAHGAGRGAGDTHPSELQARGSHRLHRGLPRHEDRPKRSSSPPTRCFWPSAWPRGTMSPTRCAAARRRPRCSSWATRRRWGVSPRPSGPPSRRPPISRRSGAPPTSRCYRTCYARSSSVRLITSTLFRTSSLTRAIRSVVGLDPYISCPSSSAHILPCILAQERLP